MQEPGEWVMRGLKSRGRGLKSRGDPEKKPGEERSKEEKDEDGSGGGGSGNDIRDEACCGVTDGDGGLSEQKSPAGAEMAGRTIGTGPRRGLNGGMAAEKSNWRQGSEDSNERRGDRAGYYERVRTHGNAKNPAQAEGHGQKRPKTGTVEGGWLTEQQRRRRQQKAVSNAMSATMTSTIESGCYRTGLRKAWLGPEESARDGRQRSRWTVRPASGGSGGGISTCTCTWSGAENPRLQKNGIYVTA